MTSTDITTLDLAIAKAQLGLGHLVVKTMIAPPNVTIIHYPHCQKANRVRPASAGFPHCANCHQSLPWVVSADQASYDAEIAASVPVVLDFWAPWCGPCRMTTPVLEHLAARYAGRMKVVKINVDENPGISARYGAMSIPLLVLIDHGREVDRQVGAAPESRLAAWIEPRLSAAPV